MEGHTQFVSLDWTLIFQWGNLLILYLIIKKFLFGPIQKMLSDRENEVKSMYDSAEKAEKDAMAASKVVERELSSEEHERLMDQFIDSVGDAPWQK